MIPAETSLFDTVAGLPVHPLVVHAAVVLLPLAALLLLVLLVVRRWRSALVVPALLALAAGTASAFVATQSGEALAARIGVPGEHEQWGSLVPAPAVALLVAGVAWHLLQRRDSRAAAPAGGGASLPTRVVGALMAVLAIVVTGLTVLAGHSGATSVWSGRLAAAAATPAGAPAPATTTAMTATPTTGATSNAAATSTAGGSYTLAQVQQHATAASCWAVVDGGVYDLTAWAGQHPGGASRILALCGRDATADFAAQHRGDRDPQETLPRFRIGTLAG
jgi:hypothetical protein